jgi:Fe-S oxidoreductase
MEARVASGRKNARLNLPELERCVHCGLCLDQCPTYRAVRLEPESPRGRIHLVRAAADGRIELNEGFKNHLYLCLLCRACETACPSGVQYGRIAEAAREELGPPGSRLTRALLDFSFKRLLPYPNRLRFIAGALRFYQQSGLQRLIGRFLPEKLRRMESMLPVLPRKFFRPSSENYPATGKRRANVAMLNGCVMPLLFPEIQEATLRVLQRNGCDVYFPAKQTCCGALNIHNGEAAAARTMARQNIDAFLSGGFDAIVVNAAGCGAAMKEYDYLLRDDPAYAEKARRFSSLVKDASEFVSGLGLLGDLAPIGKTIAYQDPCHLAHGQRVRSQPRKLLAAIPGIKIVEMAGSDRCCGSAGIYNITHPGMSQHLLKDKMGCIGATGAEAIVVPNPGCMLQLRYGSRRYGPKVEVYHLMDLLDQAYRDPDATPCPQP